MKKIRPLIITFFALSLVVGVTLRKSIRTASAAANRSVLQAAKHDPVLILPSSTITVNSTAQSPGIVGDCTLGEAIQAANTEAAVDGCNAGSGTDTIILPAGTYTLLT